MRFLRLVPLGAVCAAVAACSHDIGGTTQPTPQLAYVRYVHAMPDTGEVDVKLVDAVENLNFADPVTGYTPYRTVSTFTGIKPGSRHFRVFTDMKSNDINVVSQVILDTTIDLAPNTYYTILHTGYARAGATPHQHFVLIQEAPPKPDTGTVAVRAIVAAPGIGPVDVYTPTDTSKATPASPAFASVAYGTPTSWVNFTPGSMALRITSSGTTTPNLTQALAPAGAAQQTMLDPVAGTKIGGTALTAFIFPAGVTGSPNGKVAASIGWGVDVRPPRR